MSPTPSRAAPSPMLAHIPRPTSVRPRSMRPMAAALAALALPMADLQAEPVATAADKSAYNLFHPTPRALMREMSTDRPDKTESPYTVDAGHFQAEMDLVSFTRDRGDTHSNALTIGLVNMKAGLLNNVDLQVVIETFTRLRMNDRATGHRDQVSGFAAVITRLKVNVWGNDSGRSALAVMPYLKFPTGQDAFGGNSIEGGIIVPFAIELQGGWSVGLMAQLDLLRNESGGGHHAEFVNTVTLSHPITEKLSAYLEFFSAVSTGRGSRWVGTVDTGLTYMLTDNIQLDIGCNIGVTGSADDVNPFIGLSVRF